MSDLSQPLTPADCDLRDFKFMPMDVVRLRDSDIAAVSSGDEFRCAVLLWCAAWHQVPAASLPDDDKLLAQYAGFGRVVKEWQKLREGALRGWIKCSDGRLYHDVVAEKANEAWLAKLRQRLKTECARIKKHNERHQIKLPFPDFDAWLASGCPVGQALPVPSDIPALSPGQPPVVTGETPSKGQGEGQGQGQGQLTSKDGIDDATDGDREDDDRLPPRPQHGAAVIEPSDRAVEIATLLRAAGVAKVTSFNPDVAVTWAQDDRVTDQLLADAVALAKEAKGDAPIPVGYLKPIIAELLDPPEVKAAKPKSDDWEWARSDSGIQRKANELGIRAHGNMSYRDLADKCKDEIRKRKGAPR